MSYSDDKDASESAHVENEIQQEIQPWLKVRVEDMCVRSILLNLASGNLQALEHLVLGMIDTDYRSAGWLGRKLRKEISTHKFTDINFTICFLGEHAWLEIELQHPDGSFTRLNVMERDHRQPDQPSTKAYTCAPAVTLIPPAEAIKQMSKALRKQIVDRYQDYLNER